MSREHIVSNSLLDGDSVYLKGFPWCRDEMHTVGKSSAVSRSLCVRHNNRLSSCDATANLLRAALTRGIRGGESHNEEQFPQSFGVSGHLFARWICKTRCNALAIERKTIEPDLVDFAFGVPTSRQFFLYLKIEAGQSIQPEFVDIQLEDLTSSDGSGRFAIRLWFCGFEWWLCNYDLTSDEHLSICDDELFSTKDFVPYPEVLRFNENHQIRLNWDDQQ